ncbi:unnamed protein product [Alopecurus aequalis]
MKRPEMPVQAAKLASEGGLIARTHMPVLPHFKEYKKNKTLMKDYIGKVAENFEMDTKSDDIRGACSDILKNVSKNRRHLIKKHFFDPVAASEVSVKSPLPYITDAQWQSLVELWSSPRHKETCRKNKDNRKAVKLGQKTGSRCYVAHMHAVKEERKGEVMPAIDMFKATHRSKKDGFSEPVKEAIAKMEGMMVVPDGEAPKSAVAVVAEVLTAKSKFLKNVGLQPTSSNKSSKSNAAISAHVLDLEEKLEKSQQQAEEMREEMDAMKKKAEEAEAVQAECDKSYQLLLKRTEVNDARYMQMMALLQGKSTRN